VKASTDSLAVALFDARMTQRLAVEFRERKPVPLAAIRGELPTQ